GFAGARRTRSTRLRGARWTGRAQAARWRRWRRDAALAGDPRRRSRLERRPRAQAPAGCVPYRARRDTRFGGAPQDVLAAVLTRVRAAASGGKALRWFETDGDRLGREPEAACARH